VKQITSLKKTKEHLKQEINEITIDCAKNKATIKKNILTSVEHELRLYHATLTQVKNKKLTKIEYIKKWFLSRKG